MFYNGEKKLKELIPDTRLAEIFRSVLQEVCKGSYEIRELLNDIYLDLHDRNLFNFILPDDFEVSLPQIDTKTVKVNSIFYSVQVTYDINKPNPSKNKRFLSPSTIHSIDSYIAREMIRLANYDMLVNHDSFMSHPNHCAKSLHNYKKILNRINNSNLIDSLVSQIYGKKVSTVFSLRPKLEGILDSTYALC